MAKFLTVNSHKGMAFDTWTPDRILKAMLKAEGEVYVRKQEESLERYGVKDTGQVISSVDASAPRKTSDGVSLNVAPRGVREDGNRNAEVAFISEYGKRGQPARPAIREGNAAAEDEAIEAALAIYDDWLNSMH